MDFKSMMDRVFNTRNHALYRRYLLDTVLDKVHCNTISAPQKREVFVLNDCLRSNKTK